MTLTVVMPPARARSNVSARGSSASRMRTSGCMGPERSPPSPSPTCECVSTMPGMMTLPLASTTVAPLGTRTEPLAPTAVMRPSSMTTTPSAISGPLIGMTVAPTNAVDWPLAPEARSRNENSRATKRPESGNFGTGSGGESMKRRYAGARGSGSLGCRTCADASGGGDTRLLPSRRIFRPCLARGASPLVSLPLVSRPAPHV